MGYKLHLYRQTTETDKWKAKITGYYARWYTRHIKALVCDKIVLKDMRLATHGSWTSSGNSSFTIKAEKLPVASAFLGAKQILYIMDTLQKFFGSSSDKSCLGWTRITHLYMLTNTGGMLAYHDTPTPYLDVVTYMNDNVRVKLATEAELAAWLLEKAVSEYDLEVELALELPFLK